MLPLVSKISFAFSFFLIVCQALRPIELLMRRCCICCMPSTFVISWLRTRRKSECHIMQALLTHLIILCLCRLGVSITSSEKAEPDRYSKVTCCLSVL